jgi:hypothetical protein
LVDVGTPARHRADGPVDPPKELSPEVERERRNYLSGREHQLPGFFAPAFHLLDEKLAITVTPCADPLTPMYMLDRNFRIIDWNLAFSMCFDRTMEGRRGRNVLEWTYFLDNYEEALNHGIAVFGEGKESPRIDIEADLHQRSLRVNQRHKTRVPDP